MSNKTDATQTQVFLLPSPGVLLTFAALRLKPNLQMCLRLWNVSTHEPQRCQQLLTCRPSWPSAQSLTISWGQRSFRRNISVDVGDWPDAPSTTKNCTKGRKGTGDV